MPLSERSVMPIKFLKSRFHIFPLWKQYEGYCCDWPEAALSFDQPAPPLHLPSPDALPMPPAPPTPAPAPPLKKADPWGNLLDAVDGAANAVIAFKTWLDTPPPPAPPKAVAPPAPQKPPPFGLQDLPKAMRKLGLPMSAKLQERWFAGYENYSRTTTDLRDEIDQHGVRYAPSMVDKTTITMQWVLQFSRAKEAFDKLVNTEIRNGPAMRTLSDILRRHAGMYPQDINGWLMAGGDHLAFHQEFHFQRIAVNASWGERIRNYVERQVTSAGVPDDLTGALGAFNFYAAVQHAYIDPQASRALVSAVAVYVRDPYEFSDDQYLGHWNDSHVAVVPGAHLTGNPILHGISRRDLLKKDNILYPVTNKSYRDWRAAKKQGGDFMIYTEPLIVNLKYPFWVQL